MFIAFEGSKYFSSGSPVLLDSRFVRVGEYHGFPVYTRGGDSTTIYVPVLPGADMLARYASR